jgi:hypothetical protein
MTNIFATWMYITDETHGSLLPSAKGLSSNKGIQKIYWRSIACFFFTARYYNPQIKLVFFSNTTHIPIVDDIDFAILFKNLNVEIQNVPFDFEPPIGYYKYWQHTFYKFSIFKRLLEISSHDDIFILLDSDCLVTGDISSIFNIARSNDFIGYQIDYPPDYVVNGNSRKDLKVIFEILLDTRLPKYPTYYGGEIHASSVDFIYRSMEVFEECWKKQLELFRNKMPRFYTEEHMLTYIYYKLNVLDSINANQFIKRLWTDPTNYRNIEKSDENLLLWHLPSEKRFGFKKMFRWLSLVNFNMDLIDPTLLRARMEFLFSIPSISIRRKLFYTVKGAGKMLLKSVKRFSNN